MSIPSIEEIQELWNTFKALCPSALYLNHYELQEKTGVPNSTWKHILQIPEYADWIKTELTILRRTELAKITENVSDSRSVGQAQLITALQKVDIEQVNKSGNTFVYMYVPLDDNQKKADNVEVVIQDPFTRR